MRMRVIVVGGVAAGPKVAAKVMRLNPEADVTVIERGESLSYAGCGMPYWLSGEVKELRDLMSTPAGVVRDAAFFQKVKGVRVLTGTEALEIDRARKRIRVRSKGREQDEWLEYDRLALATGAKPVVPPFADGRLGNVHTLHSLPDVERIQAWLARGGNRPVVVIGGGLIGLETTEALVQRGCSVTLVEALPRILQPLDEELSRLVENHLASHGVTVMTDARVTGLEGGETVQGVVTTRGRLPAELVLVAVGVRPNVELARAAGLAIGVTGGIRVDAGLRTSDPDIFAVGDCAETTNRVTGKPCYVPLGSTANKQGRVAAINLCGGNDCFPGVLGSTVCRVFDYCAARTGLTEAAAREHGYDVMTAIVPDFDRAHYMPGVGLIVLKLVADARTRKLLGAQAVGPGTGDKRIDVAAMAITAGMTVDDLANADLGYAPPYATAMDAILTAANVLRNKLDGLVAGISSTDVKRRLDAGEDFLFLDVRSPAEHQQERLPGTVLIPLGALRARLGELPRDKEIVAFCKASLRGYEAARILLGAGFPRVRMMDGGVAAWPFEKLR